MSSRRFQRQVIGSKCVNERKFDQLSRLLGTKADSLKLTCLFSSRVHGHDATAFHKHCDKQGPTLTLVTGPEGYYGGYTSSDWASNSATSRIQRHSRLGASLAVTSQKSLDVMGGETRSIHTPAMDLPLVLGMT